ncbi:mitochondrial 37S ribosomal protein uS15m [Kockiozyma suomiensis]|uniref:mitochondrial 37S ribosomal protein uS15m n=1 Tax=Kockiozyma suomiensis TaxID=1337062 RepID=UPI003343DC7B
MLSLLRSLKSTATWQLLHGKSLVRSQLFIVRNYAKRRLTNKEIAEIRSKRAPYIETKKFLKTAKLPDINPIYGTYTPFVRSVLRGLDSENENAGVREGEEQITVTASTPGYGMASSEPDFLNFAFQERATEEAWAGARIVFAEASEEIASLYQPVIGVAEAELSSLESNAAETYDELAVADAKEYLASVKAAMANDIAAASRQKYKLLDVKSTENAEAKNEAKREFLTKVTALRRASSVSWKKNQVQFAIKEFGVDSMDSGSSEAQAAVLTVRILSMAEHLKYNHKDSATARRLTIAVQQRNTILKYLRNKNVARYTLCITRLGLDDDAIMKEFRFTRRLLT